MRYIAKEMIVVCDIWGFFSDVLEDSRLLEYEVLSLGVWFSRFKGQAIEEEW